MKIIVLKGRANTGKTSSLNMLINKIEGRPLDTGHLAVDTMRILDYRGKYIAICTGGASVVDIHSIFDFIELQKPDVAILTCRTKGETLAAVKSRSDNLLFQKVEILERNTYASQYDFDMAMQDKYFRATVLLQEMIDDCL